jgi:hypothetical protein
MQMPLTWTRMADAQTSLSMHASKWRATFQSTLGSGGGHMAQFGDLCTGDWPWLLGMCATIDGSYGTYLQMHQWVWGLVMGLAITIVLPWTAIITHMTLWLLVPATAAQYPTGVWVADAVAGCFWPLVIIVVGSVHVRRYTRRNVWTHAAACLDVCVEELRVKSPLVGILQ